ncbi:MAG: hypothetical protein FJW86_13545 [Actinobacteria bacterium]|nr:hypothetical protein [Actinomycetota bacterium]
MALYEVSLPTEVRPDLTTVGGYDFDGKLTTPFTAHPKIDPITGEMLFFGYDVFGPPFLRYHVVDPSGKLVTTEPITIPGPVMMHDWAITSTRAVFFDLPVLLDPAQQPFPFSWRPDHGARVGVMPRSGTDADVVWCDIDPCFVYHPMNAYDDAEGNVVVVVPRYPDMFVAQDTGPAGTSSVRLERWTIDTKRTKVTTELLDDTGQELPRTECRTSPAAVITGRRHERKCLMPSRKYSRAQREQIPRVRGPNDAIAIIKQLVCDDHTEGQLLIGIDASMRLSGAAFNCPCEQCCEETATDADQLVELAYEMDAVELVLVTFVTQDRLAPTAADVARFEGVRVECAAQGITLLDHLLMSGHRWRSIAEVSLSLPATEDPDASTRW